MPNSEDTEPTPDVPAAGSIVYVQAPSVLGRVRANRVGAFAVGLAVSLLVGLLLSTLVPSKPNVLALLLLGTLVAAAAGFTVRYLTHCRGLKTQATAFVVAVLGVHVMAVTGSVSGAGLGQIGGFIGVGSPSFGDALLVSLAVPAASTGAVIAGLVAAIIAGWGKRNPDHDEHHHHDGHDHEGHHHH